MKASISLRGGCCDVKHTWMSLNMLWWFISLLTDKRWHLSDLLNDYLQTWNWYWYSCLEEWPMKVCEPPTEWITITANTAFVQGWKPEDLLFFVDGLLNFQQWNQTELWALDSKTTYWNDFLIYAHFLTQNSLLKLH